MSLDSSWSDRLESRDWREQSCKPMLAFTAFENLLKSLCLKQFPCGRGSWVEGTPVKHNSKFGHNRKTYEKSLTKNQLQGSNVDRETTDALRDLVIMKHSPWKSEPTWSSDAKTLKEIAITSPKNISDRFIWRHFTDLRIVDMGITDIDENLLRLCNLKYLSLSANRLQFVRSQNLPRSLETLELCANVITDLSDLCLAPPLCLRHLGLAHNLLCSVAQHINGRYWPELMSVDLSHNDLSDLVRVVSSLQTLPRLRCLCLMGNPLSLVPAYRGYVVDSLPCLDYLDDVEISIDDRVDFSGMACLSDNWGVNTINLTFEIPFVKGIKIPDEILSPETQPEYPVIARKYFVQFGFIPEGSEDSAEGDDHISVGRYQCGALRPWQELDEAPCTWRQTIAQSREQPILRPVRSIYKQWSAEISMNLIKDTRSNCLLAVRNLLQCGLNLDLIEEKILSSPPLEELPIEEEVKAKKGGKKKEATKPKKVKTDLENVELIQSPPEYTTLATFHIPLDEFLDGQSVYDKLFTMEWPVSSPPPDPIVEEFVATDGKKKKDKKDAGKKSALGGDMKEKKVTGGGKGVPAGAKKAEAGEEEEVGSPAPLEIQFTARLHRWSTALDATNNPQ